MASGAEPVRLDIPGADQSHVHTLRSLADCRAIIEQAKTAIVEKLRGESNRRVVTEYRTDLTIGTQLEFFPQNLEGLVYGEDAAAAK